MNHHARTSLLPLAFALALPLALPAQNTAAVLSRLDSASAGFRSATANVERIKAGG